MVYSKQDKNIFLIKCNISRRNTEINCCVTQKKGKKAARILFNEGKKIFLCQN